MSLEHSWAADKMRRTLLPLVAVMLLASASFAHAEGEHYRFRRFGTDECTLRPIDLEACPSGRQSFQIGLYYIGEDPFGKGPFFGPWRLAKEGWRRWEVHDMAMWHLRSNGGVDLIAGLLEQSLEGREFYDFESSFVDYLLSSLAADESETRENARQDAADFLRVSMRKEPRRKLLAERARGVQDAEVIESLRPLLSTVDEAGRDLMTGEDFQGTQFFCLLNEYAGLGSRVQDRRLIPVLMLFLAHRYPVIRETAARTLSLLTWQPWLGDRWISIDERRRRWVKWWGEHREDLERTWYRLATPDRPWADDVAAAVYGDMAAYERVLRLATKPLTEGDRYLLDRFESPFTQLGLSKPWSSGPVETLQPDKTRLDAVLARKPGSMTWGEWITDRMSRGTDSAVGGGGVKPVGLGALKSWTNRSFGLEKYMTWSRCDVQDRMADKGNARWEERNRQESDPPVPREVLEAGLRNLQEWLAGEGKDFSIEARDREKIEDQVCYEEYLRARFPAAFTQLESEEPCPLQPLRIRDGYLALECVVEGIRRMRMTGVVKLNEDGDQIPEIPSLWHGADDSKIEGEWRRELNRGVEEKLNRQRYSIERIEGHPDLAAWGENRAGKFEVLAYLKVYTSPRESIRGVYDTRERMFAVAVWEADPPEGRPATAAMVTVEGIPASEGRAVYRVYFHDSGAFSRLDKIPTPAEVVDPETGPVGRTAELWRTPDPPDCYWPVLDTWETWVPTK